MSVHDAVAAEDGGHDENAELSYEDRRRLRLAENRAKLMALGFYNVPAPQPVRFGAAPLAPQPSRFGAAPLAPLPLPKNLRPRRQSPRFALGFGSNADAASSGSGGDDDGSSEDDVDVEEKQDDADGDEEVDDDGPPRFTACGLPAKKMCVACSSIVGVACKSCPTCEPRSVAAAAATTASSGRRGYKLCDHCGVLMAARSLHCPGCNPAPPQPEGAASSGKRGFKLCADCGALVHVRSLRCPECNPKPAARGGRRGYKRCASCNAFVPARIARCYECSAAFAPPVRRPPVPTGRGVAAGGDKLRGFRPCPRCLRPVHVAESACADCGYDGFNALPPLRRGRKRCRACQEDIPAACKLCPACGA